MKLVFDIILKAPSGPIKDGCGNFRYSHAASHRNYYHQVMLKVLHEKDLKRKYAGVFLINALEAKYKNAAKDFVWQWFFPAKQLTKERKTSEIRRYHLHKSHVQKAIREAVRKSKIPKRASAHTFRHTPSLTASAAQAVSQVIYCRPIMTSGRYRNKISCEIL